MLGEEREQLELSSVYWGTESRSERVGFKDLGPSGVLLEDES